MQYGNIDLARSNTRRAARICKIETATIVEQGTPSRTRREDNVNGVARVCGLDSAEECPAGVSVGAVYESERPRLTRIAAGMGLTRADAEDALHDCYVALLEQRRGFADERAAGRWLVRCVVNRCLLHHRRRKRRARLAATWAILWRRRADASASAVDCGADAKREEGQEIRRALGELDGGETAVLVLRYFCGFNATEVGEILTLPPSTVRGRLRVARMNAGKMRNRALALRCELRGAI